MNAAFLSTEGIIDPKIGAIQMAWNAGVAPKHFWSELSLSVMPLLEAARASGEVACVMPLSHKPVAMPQHGRGQWSVLVIVVMARNADPAPLAVKLGETVKRSDLGKARLQALQTARLQPNVDMFYPVKSGPEQERYLIQWVEYVVSDPARRQEYYAQQYTFSGPAMNRLHRRNCVGRFIGFETLARVVGNDDVPVWDVLHVIGFTLGQIIRGFPVFWQAWNQQAAEIWGDGTKARPIISAWDSMRDKAIRKSKQNMSLTL